MSTVEILCKDQRRMRTMEFVGEGGDQPDGEDPDLAEE